MILCVHHNDSEFITRIGIVKRIVKQCHSIHQKSKSEY